MMKTKVLWMVIVLGLVGGQVQSQVSGVSGTKFNALTVAPIPTKTVEFEPTYNVNRSSGKWLRSEFRGSDTIEVNANVSWRLTYGLNAAMELGMNIQSDLTFANFDFKSRVLSLDALELGVMGGVGVPLGNRRYAHSDPSIDDVSRFNVGLIASYALDSLTSFDLNLQMQDYFRDVIDVMIQPPTQYPILLPPIKTRLTGTTWFVNAEMGTYALHESIQLVLGAGYYSSVIDGAWTAGLTSAAAVALEMYDNYVMLFGANYAVWGFNQPKTLGMGFSFTMLLD